MTTSPSPQRPPLIGVTGRRKRGAQVQGFPDSLADLSADLYLSDYARGIVEAGGLPVYIPFEIDPVAVVERLDGLLLTGGADIDPARYGHQPETDEFPPEPVRDELELALFDAAVTRRLPVLGICRGLQLINVHAGGTLHQDVPPHALFDVAPETEAHPVTFEPSSTLGRLYGERRMVNSLHHQTVDEVGDGLVVTARAEDGTVEGLEHQDTPVVSVQWHPEMMTSRAGDPVFTWLVTEAAKNDG